MDHAIHVPLSNALNVQMAPGYQMVSASHVLKHFLIVMFALMEIPVSFVMKTSLLSSLANAQSANMDGQVLNHKGSTVNA